MTDEIKSDPGLSADAPKPPKPPKMRLGLRIILITSLALNLLVVGVVVGEIFDGDHKRARDKFDRGLPMHVQALEPKQRMQIGRELRKLHRAGDLKRGDRQAEALRMADILASVPFDRPALERAQAVTEAQFAEGAKMARTIWLDFVENMSDEERQVYAERLRDMAKERRFGPPKKD